MTTFETPCGETFRVFSEGLEIVPVAPVRADREVVVEAAQAVLEASIPIIGEDAAHVPNAALTALESALDALRATPEPERAGETS